MGYLRAIRIFVVVIAITIVLLPAHLIALKLQRNGRKTIPVLWHRGVAWALSLKVTTYGKSARAAHGTLLAANHISWLDIVALGSVAPVSFIAKDEVKGWPVFGHLARLQRTVFVARNRRTSVQGQAKAIRARLDEGDMLVLFAEGTTSNGNFVYPFKTSLFGAVGITGEEEAMHRLVQPVAIAYTHWHGQPMGRFDRPIAAWPGDIELGPHLMRILKQGVLDVVIMFGDPIEITPETDRKQLTAQVEHDIRAMVSDALRGRLPSSNRA